MSGITSLSDGTEILGKTTSFMHCLVNMCRYTLTWNPPVWKMPLVFFYGNRHTAIAKFIHKMHITVFGMGKL
jgi:hypothetical protein